MREIIRPSTTGAKPKAAAEHLGYCRALCAFSGGGGSDLFAATF
jgi:hypothetical protein